jgi:hypothetical protein
MPAARVTTLQSHRTRTQRTLETTRHGGLPTPSYDAKTWIGFGAGRPCSGCSDDIEEREREFELVSGGRSLRLHAECYNAWLAFKALSVAPAPSGRP